MASTGEVIYQTPMEKLSHGKQRRDFISNAAAKYEDPNDIWGENGAVQDATVPINADMTDKNGSRSVQMFA